MMTLANAKTSIEFLDDMMMAKKEQIDNEPNEPMWKNEMQQLSNAKELVIMELESLE